MTDKYYKEMKLSHKIPNCLNSTYHRVDNQLAKLYRETNNRRFPGSTSVVAVTYYNHPNDVNKGNESHNIDATIISNNHHSPEEYGKGESGKYIDLSNITVETEGRFIQQLFVNNIKCNKCNIYSGYNCL